MSFAVCGLGAADHRAHLLRRAGAPRTRSLWFSGRLGWSIDDPVSGCPGPQRDPPRASREGRDLDQSGTSEGLLNDTSTSPPPRWRAAVAGSSRSALGRPVETTSPCPGPATSLAQHATAAAPPTGRSGSHFATAAFGQPASQGHTGQQRRPATRAPASGARRGVHLAEQEPGPARQLRPGELQVEVLRLRGRGSNLQVDLRCHRQEPPPGGFAAAAAPSEPPSSSPVTLKWTLIRTPPNAGRGQSSCHAGSFANSTPRRSTRFESDDISGAGSLRSAR